MDPDFQALFQQISNAATESIKTVVSEMTLRQDKFEQTSRTRLNMLHEQISGLLQSLSKKKLHEEDYFHTLSPTHSVSSSISPGSSKGGDKAINSKNTNLSCNECRNLFSNLNELDSHVKSAHTFLQCRNCGKLCRSRADLNYHQHKFHRDRTQADKSFSENCGSTRGAIASHDEINHIGASTPVTSYSLCYNSHCSQDSEPPFSYTECDHGIPFPSCTHCGKAQYELEHLPGHSFPQHVSETHQTLSHHSDSLESSVLHCHLCNDTFREMLPLNVHIRQHHIMQDTLATHSSVSSTYNNFGDNVSAPEGLPDHLASKHSMPQTYTCPCYICGKTFDSWGILNNHIKVHKSSQCESQLSVDNRETGHGEITLSSSSSYYSCSLCGIMSRSLDIFNQHLKTEHDILCPEACDNCDLIFLNKEELKRHVEDNHKITRSPSTYLCYPDDSATIEQVQLNDQVRPDPDLTPSPLSQFRTSSDFIPQVDGIDDLETTIETTMHQTNSTGSRLAFDFTLNRETQAQRLIDSATKPPMNIVYNDLRNIEGKKVPANAMLDFNAGVYISAVKPALAVIKEGWKSDIAGVCLFCDKVSERTDNTNIHKVSTQLTLVLTSDHSLSKLVLHFYHTVDKVQIQGASLVQGKPSVVWLVDALIKPLTESHIEVNRDIINVINDEILTSRLIQCTSCDKNVDPQAQQPRDQPIICKQCGNTYHKKCSNRSHMRSNWKKDPWYCNRCILGEGTAQSNEHQSTLHTGHLQLDQPCPVPQDEEGSVIEVANASPMALNDTDIIALPTTLNPGAAHFVSQHSEEATQSTTIQQSPKGPRFARSLARQRGTNVNVEDPEKEFLKTAVDSCRSTIVQQESEIKRLKETMEIRNKRIIDLEAEIGFAANNLASRKAQQGTEVQDVRVMDILDKILMKLEPIKSSPNITINNGVNGIRTCTTENQASQTDPPSPESTLSCSVREKDFANRTNLHVHTQTNHTDKSVLCNTCDNKLPTVAELVEHMETDHGPANLQCMNCNYSCTSKEHMSDHIAASHDSTSTNNVHILPEDPGTPDSLL